MSADRRRVYWRKNLQYLAILLAIWFAVSFGAGILLVDELDRIRVGGFKLGFWFAQQGSIYAFIAIIFVYVRLMNRLDRRFEVEDRRARPLGGPAADVPAADAPPGEPPPPTGGGR